MAHFASRKMTHLGQFGVLIGLAGAGIVFGTLISIIPLISKFNFSDLMKMSDSKAMVDMVFKPENANTIRLMQFLSVLFLFLLPAWFYAKICHRKPLIHFGLNRKIGLPQLILAAVVMVFAMILVGAIQEVWHQIPFSASWKAKFKEAEDLYNKQMVVMARMNGVADLILSLLVIAVLPAIAEELVFRGALQNLLSRWMKGSIWSVVIVSVVFSLIHFSYDGFIARTALGFILGWMYYRTGNLWLSITGHFVNNAIGVFVLYAVSKPGQPLDLNKLDERFPIWYGAVALAGVLACFYWINKRSQNSTERPGQELIMDVHPDVKNTDLASN